MKQGIASWLLLFVCVLSSACTSEFGDTAILLTVDSDLDVPDELDRITVEGTGFDSENAPSADLRTKSLPRSITLNHESGPYGPLTLTVTGYHGEQRVVQRTVRTSFVPGYVTSLRVELTRVCLNVVCGDGLTCEDGACRGIAFAVPASMEPDAATPMSTDAGSTADASSAKFDASAADASTVGLDASSAYLDASAFVDAAAKDATASSDGASSSDASDARDAAVTRDGAAPTDAAPAQDATTSVSPGATPVCSISKPSNAATLATELEYTLQGSCNDHESGPLTQGLVWSSQLDGQIATGASAKVRLRSPGMHVLKLCAPDPISSSVVGCGSVTVIVLTYAPASARINAVRQGVAEGNFVTGRSIVMQGSGTGTGMLTLRWTDNLQGALGTGAVATLSQPVAGRHVITLQVTDQLGTTAMATHSFTVTMAGRP